MTTVGGCTARAADGQGGSYRIVLTENSLNDGSWERTEMAGWIWEILRYVAAWGGTGLIIWFWYWMFSNIGTF